MDWIKLSDKKPPKNKLVLIRVQDLNGDVETMRGKLHKDDFGVWGVCGVDRSGGLIYCLNVTHWKSLLYSPTSEEVGDLKPCPFCGSSEVIGYWEERRKAPEVFVIACGQDGCPVQVETYGDSEEEAARYWNKRNDI